MRAADWFDSLLTLNEALLSDARPDYGVLPCGCLAADADTFDMDNSDTARDGVGRTCAEVDGYCPLARQT